MKNKRQIVLDTETTGLSPKQGHRIIEIGCIEMIDRQLTKKRFHTYINPQRLVDPGAVAVHGIKDDFLTDKPLFAEIADEFFAFIKGAELIIHNAPFDISFMDHEFHLYNKKLGEVKSFCSVVDSLVMARKKHPGQKNNLDALCRRYDIDNSNRSLHGALLDAQILANVYLAMTGGQVNLFGARVETNENESKTSVDKASLTDVSLKIQRATEQELSEHSSYLQEISEQTSGQCLWSKEKD